ncbi:hypothetical protein [Pseudomonas sp. DP-17]|uniref:hypothetical protein n=1 Tax=Pseudomonas sp. DP-17 TaxID=1580486 RepID=UPI001EFB2591|nr:hypothetical protein [Pseudomonas sp. DP-17]MCG8910301.1 hypothetical protein [Pseudomonas sp. DP-17]
MTHRASALVVCALIVTGCTGHIVNRPDLPLACRQVERLSSDEQKTLAESDEKVCSGVIYYPLAEVKETYWYDRILDKDGKITRHAGGIGQERCAAVEITETKLAPSNSASLISYDPGLLENSKFTVGLTPAGTLASVGTDSTPMGKAAAEALSSIVTSIKVLKIDANIMLENGSLPPYCNAGRLPFKPATVPEPKKGGKLS